MVFGVFDGLHAGHRYFLTEASRRCKRLMVVVTPSETVRVLKGRLPHRTYEERAKAIRLFDPKLDIISGDTVLGTWTVLEKHPPEVVFLGYDQQTLADELTKQQVPFVTLDSHYPEKHKSSLLHTSTRADRAS